MSLGVKLTDFSRSSSSAYLLIQTQDDAEDWMMRMLWLGDDTR